MLQQAPHSVVFNMTRVNDQTILEEDYDENYEPTEEGFNSWSRTFRTYIGSYMEL